MRFVLMQDDVPPQRGRERNFILPFVEKRCLKSLLSNNTFSTKLGEYAMKMVTSCYHHHYGSKKSWFNLPKKRVNFEFGTSSSQHVH
jgi:hypothetical protein